MRWLTGSSRGERGVILPLTLIMLVVLAAMVAALLAVGVSEPQIAANVLRGSQALSLAEAGAEKAIAYYQITANQAAINRACDPTCSATVTTLFNAETLSSLGSSGTYTVTTREISFGSVLVESTGTVTVGSPSVSRVVRVVLTKAWTTRFGVLGDTVEIDGSASVYGNQGAVHGNTSTQVDTAALVQKTATTAGSTCTGCLNECTTRNCSTAQPPPSGSKGVGIIAGSGTGAPAQTLPSTGPTDLAPKANIIMGGGGSADPSIPAGKCTSIAVFSGSNFTGSYSGTTVPQHWVLDARTTTCKLFPDNSAPAPSTLGANYAPGTPTSGSNPFSNWRMNGAGEWELSGNVTPPDGGYYATKEFKISGTPGSMSTPWNATLIAGTATEHGEVEIEGNSVIKSYTPLFGDLLALAGEIEAKGNTTLTGTLMATGTPATRTRVGGLGEIELGGSVVLNGNAVTNGEAEVGGNAKVIYNVAGRTRLLGPGLVVVSWSSGSTLQ